MNMTKEQMKDFKPSEEMIRATELVFLCMANVDVLKPIVEGYQRKVLAKHKFQIDDKWKEGKRIILEPEHSYLLNKKDWKTYFDETRVEQEKAKLKTKNPEHCPLLVAQHDLSDAENLLIETWEPVTELKVSQVNMGLNTRKKFLDITLRYMSSFVDTKQVLKNIRQGAET